MSRTVFHTGIMSHSPQDESTLHAIDATSDDIGGRCSELCPDVFHHRLIFELGHVVKTCSAHDPYLHFAAVVAGHF